MKQVWAIYVKGDAIPEWMPFRLMVPSDSALEDGPEDWLRSELEMWLLGLSEKPNVPSSMRLDLALKTAKRMKIVVMRPDEEYSVKIK